MTNLEQTAEWMLARGNTTGLTMVDLHGNLVPLLLGRHNPEETIKLARGCFLTHAAAIFERDIVNEPEEKAIAIFRVDQQGKLIPRQGAIETGGISFSDFQAIYDVISSRSEITSQELHDLVDPYWKKVSGSKRQDLFR